MIFILHNKNSTQVSQIFSNFNYYVIHYQEQPKLKQEKQGIQKVKIDKGNSLSYNPLWLLDDSKRNRISNQSRMSNQSHEAYLPQLIYSLRNSNQNSQRIQQMKKQQFLTFNSNNQQIMKGNNFRPHQIVPKEIRKNPLTKPKVVHETTLVKEGLFNLINKGLIDRYVDVGPAFQNSIVLANNFNRWSFDEQDDDERE